MNRIKTCETEDIGEHDTVDDTQVNKIRRKETDKTRYFTRFDNNACHQCMYLSKDLDVFIDTRHNPKMCKRKKRAIQNFHAESNSSDSG